MSKILIISVLLFSVCFSTEVVAFEDSWSNKPLFTVVSETPTSVEIIFSMHRMVVEEREIDGIPMKNFGVPGMFLPNDEGAPNLTGTGRYIAIPEGSRARATVLDARTEVYRKVDIAPAPNIPPEADILQLRYIKDMNIYSRNAYYPETPVKLSETKQIRGVDVVILGVRPFQYNPVTKDLVVYKDLRIRVDFVGGNDHFGEDRLRSRFWEPILQGHLLNYGSLPQIDYCAPERIGARDGWEYIIIVPDDDAFEAAAAIIKARRKLQGISTEVFTLPEIGGEIENFLNNAYNTWDPAPAAFLLLGDESHISAVIWQEPGYGDWGHSDNVYADVDNDNLPDMHHARICAQSESHLDAIIDKLLSYENNPCAAQNFYDEPLIAGCWGGGTWYQLCTEVMKGFFVNVQAKNPVMQYAGYAPNPPCPWSSVSNTDIVVEYFGPEGLGYITAVNMYPGTYWNSGSAQGINDAINSGAFFVLHRDHGAEDGWVNPDYRIPDLDCLSNTYYPFVFSINCATGDYTYVPECFAEKFYRMENGALGVNAASNESFPLVNTTYAWGIFDCLWPEFMPDYPCMGPQLPVGEPDLMPCVAMTSGKYFLEASSWPENAHKKDITYHLYHHHGDCFITLYSEVPENLTVSHAQILPEGYESYTVIANEGAVIALTVNGEIIGVAEGTGGPVDIPLPGQTGGNTMRVTVTKANYYRYEEDVPVTAGLQGEIYDGHGGPLTAAGSPYYISGDAWVPVGEVLTIDPDVIIYFAEDSRMSAHGTGMLEAHGNSEEPIYLVSYYDFPNNNGVKLRTHLKLKNDGYFRVPGSEGR